MNARRLRSLACWLVLVCSMVAAAPPPTRVRGPQPHGIGFVENVGQFEGAARFQLRGGGQTLWVADDALWLTRLEPLPAAAPDGMPLAPAALARRGVHLKLSFAGANPAARLEPFDRRTPRLSYFGGAATRWRRDVPVWGGLRWAEVAPGVDLELVERAGALAPRLVCRASCPAALRDLRLRVEGAASARVVDDALRVSTDLGDVTFPLLEVVTPDGSPLPPPAAPTVAGNEVVAPFRDTPRLAAPPAAPHGSDLLFLTFLSGSGTEYGWDIAADAAGSAYLTGMTDSSDFPTTPGAFEESYGGNFDAYVAKLNPAGDALVYATFLGGSALDQGSKLAVDGAGNVTVAGYTYSADFPTTPAAFDPSFNGGEFDAFVARLNASGTDLVFSTFLGGSADDFGAAVALDGAGRALATGYTESPNFPTTAGAYDATYNGGGDIFAVQLAPDGDALAYATLLGSGGFEIGKEIAADGLGHLYLTGHTTSGAFPTTPGAYDTSFNGGQGDAVVVRLDPATSALSYSTFLGGEEFDEGQAIAVDAGGHATVAGRTNSILFPTTPGAYDTSYGGGRDIFVAKVAPEGNALAYSTFVGGSGEEEAGGVAVDGAGQAHVAGYTLSPDFPITPDGYDTSANGDYDPVFVRLNAAGSALGYGTFLGDGRTDYGRGIALDGAGAVFVGGHAIGEGQDAFALKLLPPTPPTRVELSDFAGQPSSPAWAALRLLLLPALAGLLWVAYRRGRGRP